MTDETTWSIRNAEAAQSLTISFSNPQPLLTFTPDGRIVIGDGLKPDEAAWLFLESLARMYPDWLRNPVQNPDKAHGTD